MGREKYSERVRVILDKIRGGMREKDKVLVEDLGHSSTRRFDCHLHRFIRP